MAINSEFVIVLQNFSLFSDNQAAGSTPSKATTPAGRPKGSVIDLTEDDDDDVQGKKKDHPAFIMISTSSPIMKEKCKMLYCDMVIGDTFDQALVL